MHPFPLLTQIGDMMRGMTDVVPRIVTAVGLVLAGWLLALLLRYLSRRAADSGLRRLGRGTAMERALETEGTRGTAARIVGGFVFWVVFLLFVLAAAETLGLAILSTLLSEVTYYLPNVLAAILIMLGGIVLGRVASTAVAAAATSAGIARAQTLGRIVYLTMLLVAAIVGLEQIGVEGRLFVTIVAVVFATFLGGAGLAFGLGARAAVSNIIASHYVAQAYRPGQTVRIGPVEGRIVETTRTAVLISTSEGRVMVPATKFSEETSTLLTESA